MSHRRRPRRGVPARPTGRSTRRSCATRWPRRRARGGVTIAQRTRVTAIDDRTTAGSRGVRTDRGDIECEVVVDCGGMFAAEIARLAGVRVPIVPMSHQYVVTEPFLRRAGTGPLPTLRDPDLLVYYRQEVDGLVMGGYERDARAVDRDGRLARRRPGRLQRPAAARRLGPVRRDRRERRGPGAGAGRRRRPHDDQRAGGVHPGQRVLPRRDRRRRLLRRRRVLRARHRRRGRDRAGDGRVDPRRRPRAGPVAHGRAPVRPRSTARRRYTLARVVENYETYYDIRLPGQRAPAGRPLRISPAYPWHAAHGAVFGEKAGLGAGQLLRRSNARRRGDDAAAAGLGRARLVALRSARAPGRPRGGRRCSTSRPSPRSRSTGPGAAELRSTARVRQRVGAPPARSRTPRRSTTAAASRATSPSPGVGDGRFLS